MKKIISAALTANILIISFSLLIIFHLSVLLRIAPYDIVWGGRIDNVTSMLIYEGTAVIILLLFIVIIALKTHSVKTKRLNTAAGYAVWIVFGYFILGIAGNIASASYLEKVIFTPVTIALALLTFRLAIEK